MVQKAVILGESDRIRPSDLGLDGEDDYPSTPAEAVSGTSLYAIRDQAESQAIREALAKAQGNVSLTARILEVDRKVLIRTLERLSICPDDYK